MESFDWGVTLIGEFKILKISGLIFSKMQVLILRMNNQVSSCLLGIVFPQKKNCLIVSFNITSCLTFYYKATKYNF